MKIVLSILLIMMLAGYTTTTQAQPTRELLVKEIKQHVFSPCFKDATSLIAVTDPSTTTKDMQQLFYSSDVMRLSVEQAISRVKHINKFYLRMDKYKQMHTACLINVMTIYYDETVL